VGRLIVFATGLVFVVIGAWSVYLSGHPSPRRELVMHNYRWARTPLRLRTFGVVSIGFGGFSCWLAVIARERAG
jgi:hypothetical protein